MSMNMRNLGGRPKKLDIKLTAESLEGALKNIWNEAEEVKLKAIQQYNKQIRDISSNTDIAMIGKTNADYLKIVGDSSGRKLEVAKLIQTYIQKDMKASDSAGIPTSGMITEEEKAEFAEMMNQALQNDKDEIFTIPEPSTIQEIQEKEDEELKRIISGEDNEDDITNAGF